MNRIVCVIGAFCLILLALPVLALPQQSIPADRPLGKAVTLSINSANIADAYQVGSEVLVPLYATLPLGLEPHMNAATGVIILQKPGLVFRLKMGNRSAACNGKPFALSVAPRPGTTSPDTPDSEADTDARLPPIPFVPILALAHRLHFNVDFTLMREMSGLHTLCTTGICIRAPRLPPFPRLCPTFFCRTRAASII